MSTSSEPTKYFSAPAALGDNSGWTTAAISPLVRCCTATVAEALPAGLRVSAKAASASRLGLKVLSSSTCFATWGLSENWCRRLVGGGSGTLCASNRTKCLAISGSLFKPVFLPREMRKFSLFAIVANDGLASSPFILNQFSELRVILPLCMRRTAELKFDDGIMRSTFVATGLASAGREYAIQSSDMFQLGLYCLAAALGLRPSRSSRRLSRGLTSRSRMLKSCRGLSSRALMRAGGTSDLPRLKLPRTPL
mmetsp:Transcript_65712/g.154628  ORF Transcript_65712/g.154628 Transcript_65712/m.154628 type:complete len:252 (+) Transcript_65712:374-1129(+)